MVGYKNDTAPESPSKASEKVGKATNTTLEEISNASKMNALQTKDRNVVEGQNGHPLESPKAAAEKVNKSEKTVRRGLNQEMKEALGGEIKYGVKMTP